MFLRETKERCEYLPGVFAVSEQQVIQIGVDHLILRGTGACLVEGAVPKAVESAVIGSGYLDMERFDWSAHI